MSLRSRAAAAALVSCLALGAPAAAFGVPAAAAAAAVPWRSVSFDGVTLTVPATWPVVNLTRNPAACPRLDVHAVYLGRPGPAPACPASLTGSTETVQIQRADPASPQYQQATTQQRLNGSMTLTNRDASVSHTITNVIARAGVQVTLTYRDDLAVTLRIQSSIKVSAGATAPRLPAPATARPGRQQASAGGRQNPYSGPGFDACAAPAAATMTHWLESPYRAVGVYIGGVNRACAQANLTSAWLTGIAAQGWHYFPFYVGLQADCTSASGVSTINAGQAAQQGTAAANDAVHQAQLLGIPTGSPIIFDMEAYSQGCNPQVITFLSAWDNGLHAKGYQSGVYESFTNVGALVSAAGSMTEPDVIHYADWDGHATTTSSYMPANMWVNHQRLHQYRGGHAESYGGVTLHIDNDQLDVNLNGGGGGTPGPTPHPGFRIAVGINANGTAELFARAANRTLAHAWQRPVGSSGFSLVHEVGKSPKGLTGNPAVATEQHGGLTVFAATTAGQIAHAWQNAAFPNGWEWGRPLPAPPGHAASGTDPAAVRLPGGDVAVFVTTRGGAIAETRQLRPDADTSWTGWVQLGGSCASSPAALLTPAGRAEVACVTQSGSAAVDAWNGRSWSGWASSGGQTPGLTGVPALIAGPGGITGLYANTTAGGLAYGWQGARSATWTWTVPVAGGLFGASTVNSPAASWWPGRQVALFTDLASGQPSYLLDSGAPPGSFGFWQPVSTGPAAGSAQGSPVAWVNADGTPELGVLNGYLHLSVTRYSGGGWTNWTGIGGSF